MSAVDRSKFLSWKSSAYQLAGPRDKHMTIYKERQRSIFLVQLFKVLTNLEKKKEEINNPKGS